LPTFWCTYACEPTKTTGACSTHTISTHNPHNHHTQPSHHSFLLLIVIVIVIVAIVVAISANILAQWRQRWQWRREGEGQGNGAVFCREAYPGFSILVAIIGVSVFVICGTIADSVSVASSVDVVTATVSLLPLLVD
jgi:hypothetical protein